MVPGRLAAPRCGEGLDPGPGLLSAWGLGGREIAEHGSTDVTGSLCRARATADAGALAMEALPGGGEAEV